MINDSAIGIFEFKENTKKVKDFIGDWYREQNKLIESFEEIERELLIFEFKEDIKKVKDFIGYWYREQNKLIESFEEFERELDLMNKKGRNKKDRKIDDHIDINWKAKLLMNKYDEINRKKEKFINHLKQFEIVWEELPDFIPGEPYSFFKKTDNNYIYVPGKFPFIKEKYYIYVELLYNGDCKII
jgi:hypothetical protein